VSDDGRERGGVVVRRDMSGGKGGSRVIGCRLCKDGGRMMDGCVVVGDDRCLLSSGESVWDGVVFAFFFTRLVRRGLGIL